MTNQTIINNAIKALKVTGQCIINNANLNDVLDTLPNIDGGWQVTGLDVDGILFTGQNDYLWEIKIQK